MSERKNDIDGAEIARRAARQFLADDQLVPLSILGLDHPEPLDGWASLGLEIIEDDLLRPCLRREDARKLAQERRERERADVSRRRDTLKPPPVAAGVPALEDGTPFESLVAAGYVTPQQEFSGRERPNFLDDELAAGRRRLAEAQEEAKRVAKDA